MSKTKETDPNVKLEPTSRTKDSSVIKQKLCEIISVLKGKQPAEPHVHSPEKYRLGEPFSIWEQEYHHYSMNVASSRRTWASGTLISKEASMELNNQAS